MGLAISIEAPWTPVREFLEGISRSRAQQGFSAEETASFIFSFKKPLFAHLRKELGKNAQALYDATWSATQLVDRFGLHHRQSFSKST